jgi:hypothetical protein
MWAGIRFEINPTLASVSVVLLAISLSAFALTALSSRASR